MRRRDLLSLPAGLLALPLESGESETPRFPRPVRMLFGGDVMLSRHVGRVAAQRNDPAWPFREIAPVLCSADLSFVNLESPFSDRGRRTERGMVFKAEPEMIEGLKLAGITAVSTANNHCRDCGSYGLEFTIDWLGRNGIVPVGTGKDAASAHAGAILEREGTRFGLLAYTYDQRNGNHTSDDDRVAMLNLEEAAADVRAMKQRADVVIVSMHAGTEYRSKPNADQIRFARGVIDAGATLVIGHHPHVVQPVEVYKAGVIFYSLGNFVFDQSHREDTQHGLLAEVTFDGPRLIRHQALPIDIRGTVPRLAASPRVKKAAAAAT